MKNVSSQSSSSPALGFDPLPPLFDCLRATIASFSLFPSLAGRG
jgi:hypothetical protein